MVMLMVFIEFEVDMEMLSEFIKNREKYLYSIV
jgi:hypothetical protein